MKTLIIKFTFMVLWVGICYADAPKIIISERPEWQKPIIDKASFGVQVKSTDQILGENANISGGFWSGFLIFSCTAKENLGRRILWIDAEVEFSNGYVRKFEGIKFHISAEGSEYDIAKIPFETKDAVTVKSMTITSVTIK